MPGIILDTNVVSEPKRARPDANVVAWFERQAADQLYLTSTIVAELAFGIEIMPPGRRRRGFEIWLHERVVGAFRGRILAFDDEAALLYGGLMARARRQGRPARVGDAQIAATALRHGLAIATRNTGDFALFDAPLINPWQALG
ncbi:MAG: type II toxin-antitoxin system VapC family toxin [Geminicoccaceae bacterium]